MIREPFKNDWMQRNWYPVMLGPQFIPSNFWFQHEHEPGLKEAFPEVRDWLTKNCQYGWEIQFAKSFERGTFIHICRVVFRAKVDAALFKMIWT